MSNQIRTIVKAKSKTLARGKEITLRKHLNADALFHNMRKGFQDIKDTRTGNGKHSLADALMSGFAMFSLKDPSLLQFDARRSTGPHNLKTIYGIGTIPCDTTMREILDEVDPNTLRPLFKDGFRALQRGKALEQMVFMDGYYLLNFDGTGYFNSKKLFSDACMKKVDSKTGEVSYYIHAVGAVLVHPDHKVVIPLCPEMIIKQDGETKNDCERNAIKRLLKKLKKDHPHLKLIINEDSLSSNAPHIRELEKYEHKYILGVKEGDHKFLFNYVDQAVTYGKSVEFDIPDEQKEHITHCFRIVYDAPLNQSNQDCRITFVEYWQHNEKTGKNLRFSWVTNLDVTRENACQFMRGARARWKIENETFNTLKNQGYHFGHNFGLGKKHLSEVFVMLMMLAFMIDQIMQLCCPLFNAVWKKLRTKQLLWEHVRIHFQAFLIDTMEELYRSILDHKPVPMPKQQ